VAAFLLMLLIVWLRPGRRFWGALPPIAGLMVVAAGLYYGLAYFDDANRLAERRALEERAAALLAQTVQPGSVLACIDGSPAPAMYEACERTLFAEPQHVAAATAIVNQRLAYIADAIRFASSRDPGYFERIESMRNAVESDAYGFVAYVLANEHRCTPDSCDRLGLLRDPARVKENMRVRRFEAFMVKHAMAWRDPSRTESSTSSILPVPEPTIVPGVSISDLVTGIGPRAPGGAASTPSAASPSPRSSGTTDGIPSIMAEPRTDQAPGRP
jgi:hypothetical protein